MEERWDCMDATPQSAVLCIDPACASNPVGILYQIPAAIECPKILFENSIAGAGKFFSAGRWELNHPCHGGTEMPATWRILTATFAALSYQEKEGNRTIHSWPSSAGSRPRTWTSQARNKVPYAWKQAYWRISLSNRKQKPHWWLCWRNNFAEFLM